MGLGFNLRSNERHLRCPYEGCEKTFDKPTVITDTVGVTRETHFACPYCMSKIDITTGTGGKIVDIKAIDYPRVFDSPAKCVHVNGSLDHRPLGAPLPDDCLVCPKVMQCTIRKG
jgi:DNA-directed RNA polymerase subunit RPC12/RpoP